MHMCIRFAADAQRRTSLTAHGLASAALQAGLPTHDEAAALCSLGCAELLATYIFSSMEVSLALHAPRACCIRCMAAGAWLHVWVFCMCVWVSPQAVIQLCHGAACAGGAAYAACAALLGDAAGVQLPCS